MKALTVRQPWAWAIMHGGKNVENRKSLWAYRGRLALHAGLQTDISAFSFKPLDDVIRQVATDAELERRDFGDQWTGAILGTVDLVDTHPADPAGCCAPWGFHGLGTVHLVFENPRPLPRIIRGVKGQLGLWALPDPVDRLLTERAGVVGGRREGG